MRTVAATCLRSACNGSLRERACGTPEDPDVGGGWGPAAAVATAACRTWSGQYPVAYIPFVNFLSHSGKEHV
eukprot:2599951-Pyramimonas_sp.AAC.1